MALRDLPPGPGGRSLTARRGSRGPIATSIALDRHFLVLARQGPVAPPPARDGMLYGDAEALVRQLISRRLAG